MSFRNTTRLAGSPKEEGFITTKTPDLVRILSVELEHKASLVLLGLGVAFGVRRTFRQHRRTPVAIFRNAPGHTMIEVQYP